MGAGSVFLSILALFAIITQAASSAHPLSSSHHVIVHKIPTYTHSAAAKAPSKVHHHIPYKTPAHGVSSKTPTKTPAGKHHPVPSKSAKAALGNANQQSIYAAEASMIKNGLPTPLDAVQAQASKNLAGIAAAGVSLHAAGVASVASASKAAMSLSEIKDLVSYTILRKPSLVLLDHRAHTPKLRPRTRTVTRRLSRFGLVLLEWQSLLLLLPPLPLCPFLHLLVSLHL